MRIAIAQINSTAGDIAGNTARVLKAIEHARNDKADVLVCPEMVILGYPPRDLLLRRGVIETCEQAIRTIQPHTEDLTAIIGTPRSAIGSRRVAHNSAVIFHDGRIIETYDKRLLPGYDVFDEDRYFEPGNTTCIVDIAGTRAGILICEDLWRAEDVTGHTGDIEYAIDPPSELATAGCDVILVPSASPFVAGKGERHLTHLQTLSTELGMPIVLVNQVGGNDDLVFDGRSFAVTPAGGSIQLDAFREDFAIIDPDDLPRSDQPIVMPAREEEIFHALVCGTRDYCHKTGHTRALLGLSGGLDSALVATIAAIALGPENVTAAMMPSKFSSAHSLTDAQDVAKRLRLSHIDTIPIREAHAELRSTLARAIGEQAEGVTDENLQARLRGILLMARANTTGDLLLATSNKSEMAVGYSTLYGDMCGGLAIIADLLKTDAYDIARWVNEHHAEVGLAEPPFPDSVLTRPPSAELRPDQTDQDTLPPYEILDEIIRRYVDRDESAENIIAASGFDPELVVRWTKRIDIFEYKRFQAPVILKISPRAFGRGRPMPIVMKSSAIAESPSTTAGPSRRPSTRRKQA